MKRPWLAAALLGCFGLGLALLFSAPIPDAPPANAGSTSAGSESGPARVPAREHTLPPPPARVVMILIDALRADRLSAYGNPKPLAPFLDGLAARGVVFEQAHAASTWTSSSVASLFTGLYPHEHQVWTGFAMSRRSLDSDAPLRLNRLPDSAPTLAERMKQWGYSTFGASNNPNFAQEMGFRRGFDRFEHFGRKTGDVINQAALQMAPDIEAAPRAFVYLHYMDTHKPYRPRDPWLDRGEPNASLARYDSELGYVDQLIGQLSTPLGFDRDTLVIVLADHGEEFGEHGGQGHINQVHGELMRVPLVLYHRSGLTASRISTPVSLVDLLPTLEAWLGKGATHTRSSGTSLVPLLEGKDLPDRPLFAMRTTETEEPHKLREAVLRGGYKYIRSTPEERHELYDTGSDPYEQHDLHASEPAITDRLRSELDAYKGQNPPLPRAFADSEKSAAELSEQLRSLGYVQ